MHRSNVKEAIELLMNSMNQGRIDVFDTFVYRYGLQNLQYSYATAVGLFNTVINIALLIVVNKVVSKASEVEFV